VRICALLTALGSAAGATGTLKAQDQCRLDELTEWRPRVAAYLEDGLRAADRAVIESTLGPVEALVRKTAYGTPRGFWVRPWWGHVNRPDASRLLPYNLAISTFLRCNKSDEHAPAMEFIFNPNPQSWSEGDRPMRDEHGDGLYFNRVRTETLFGATATYGHFEEENTSGLAVLFTAGGVSPTIPVAREAYLRAMIFTLEGKDQAKVKEAVAFASKTQYQRWTDGAAQRKKDREQILAGIATVDPSQVPKVRADLEKTEREGEASLKKSEAAEREVLDQAIANATAPGDKLRAQIAAMSPEERASPAFVFGNQELVPAGTPNAMAVVRVDPAFYRASGSSFEARAVLVLMPNAYEEVKAQHSQLYRDFDWAALKALVNKKP
jgi:hypothetical protein